MMREFFGTQFHLTRRHGTCLVAVGVFSFVLLLQMNWSGAIQVMLIGWRLKPSLRLPPAYYL